MVLLLFFFFLLHFLKLYNRNDGVTGKFFTLYEMVKVKMLRSSMQVKYPANRNMSETSASYQADDATELVNRTVSIYLICFTCNTFSICLSGYLAAPVAQTLNCCSHED